MKRILPTLLLALMLAPMASAQSDAPRTPPPSDDPPRAREASDRPSERAGRPERGERDQSQRGPRGQEDRAGRGRGRGRPEQGERSGRGERHWRLTEDQLDQALEIIERLHPELAQSLRDTRAQNPQQAVQRISEEFPRVHELLAMHEHEPERFELHIQSIQIMRASVPLIRQLRQAQREEDQDAIDQLTAQVREKVERMFDLRMAIRQLEVQELRERIAQLEAQLADDQDGREEHINQRTQQVVEGEGHPGRPHRGGPPNDRPHAGPPPR